MVQVQSQGVPGKPKAKPPMVFGSPGSTDSNLTKNIEYGTDQSNQPIRPGSGPPSGGGGASNRHGNRVIEGSDNELPPIDRNEKENGVRGKQSNISFLCSISYNLYG